MPIKQELSKLKKIDVWSLMLFVLYNFQKIPEYSAISELAYILDEKSMLKLCEYFGGQTIKIPTIDELEITLYAMLLYQYIDIENMSEEDAISAITIDKSLLKSVKSCYATMKNILKNYDLTSRGAI